MTLGIALLQGPRRGVFLMREVPLYSCKWISQEVHSLRGLSSLGVGSNRLFQLLDLYWRPPESGVLWYKPRQLKTTIWWLAEHGTERTADALS